MNYLAFANNELQFSPTPVHLYAITGTPLPLPLPLLLPLLLLLLVILSEAKNPRILLLLLLLLLPLSLSLPLSSRKGSAVVFASLLPPKKRPGAPPIAHFAMGGMPLKTPNQPRRAEGPRYPSLGQRPRSQPRLTIGGLKARAKCLIRPGSPNSPTYRPGTHPQTAESTCLPSPLFSFPIFSLKITCQAPKPPKSHKRNKIELAC
jgi:hypothetical protein